MEPMTFTEAQKQRRSILSEALRVSGERRLTRHEAGIMFDELEDWLAHHPDHDAGLHEGRMSADMAECSHCSAVIYLSRVKELLPP